MHDKTLNVQKAIRAQDRHTTEACLFGNVYSTERKKKEGKKENTGGVSRQLTSVSALLPALSEDLNCRFSDLISSKVEK